MEQLKGPRILLMAGWYYPESIGGTEIYVHAQAKELESLGCEIMIAVPSNDEKERAYIHDGLPVYRYPVALHPEKAEITTEKPPRYLDIFEQWFRKNKPDLVHMHSYTRGCGFFHARLIKQIGVPVILTVHVPGIICARGTMLRWGNVPCDGKIMPFRCATCYLQKQGVPRVFGALFNIAAFFIGKFLASSASRLNTALHLIESLALRKDRFGQLTGFTDHTILLAQWHIDAYRINGAPISKITLLRHGLPPELLSSVKVFREARDPGRPLRVGYIGRFDPAKGVKVLIEAVKRLPRDVRVELRLYGRVNNDEGQRYFNMLNKISAPEKRIIFSGEVTEDNRAEVFKSLDIIAVPSLWVETGPLVVLEAFSAGIPIIGSNLGGIDELVTPGVNGMLVKPADTRAWSAALLWIYGHPESTRDWSHDVAPVKGSLEVTKEVKKIYDQVLGARMRHNQ